MSTQSPARASLDLGGFVQVAAAAASWGTWSLFLRPTELPATVTTPVMFLVVALCTAPGALRAPPMVWDRGTVALIVGTPAGPRRIER